MVDHDMITTLHPEKRVGIRMRSLDYCKLRDCILGILRERQEVPLGDVLQEAVVHLQDVHQQSRAWFVLMVKLDLEAKGLIKTKIISKGQKGQMLMLQKSRRGRTLISRQIP